LNNNRGNNRRRGRGGNRQQGQQQQLNRIDSRARGNAPQLLEKYKKLAHDAHLNGDRVQEEYYLQFADHYFRVIADQKQRQDEAREKRRDDRGQDGYDGERGRYDASDSASDDDEIQDSPRKADADSQGDDGDDETSVYEPVENPFVRENRSPRAGKDRKPRRQSREESDDGQDDDALRGLDPSALPPAISASSDSSDEKAEEKPRRRTRRTRPAEDDGGETLEAVS